MPFYDKYVLTEPDWLLYPYILKNELSGIVSEPGLGKDIWLCDLAARLSRGWPMPPWSADDALAPEGDVPGYVILATPEDSPTDTIGWRLKAAGADMRLIYDMNKVGRRQATAGIQRSRFSIPTDLPHMKHVITSINEGIDPDTGKELEVKAPVHACIVGPLASVATETISHNQTVRHKILDPMQSIAEETGCAIVLEMHFNRGSRSKNTPLIDRINGSMAGIVGAMRVISAIMNDEINSDIRRVMPLKTNITSKNGGEPLEYIIAGGRLDPHVRYRVPPPDPTSISFETLKARIVAEISVAERPVTAQELAAYLRLAHGLVRQILQSCEFDGLVVRRRGAYTVPAIEGPRAEKPWAADTDPLRYT